MTAREEGFLLLTGSLGNPDRKPLTVPQFRELTRRMRQVEKPLNDGDLAEKDLLDIGLEPTFAKRILQLLSQQDELKWYLEKGRKQDCYPLTRNSSAYPTILHKRLHMEAPGVLWTKGDRQLLKWPAVSLVGSRDLREENREFAQEVGKQAAMQGYVLVSGNARGADKTAQDACLENGGKVIVIVADELEKHPLKNHVLYISEGGFNLAFSAARALQRNRVIHSLGLLTFVAQCTLGKGGTWDGATQNLRHNWNPVVCFDDESPAVKELVQMGAVPVKKGALSDFQAMQSSNFNFLP
ncbi:MAG: DNA-protecting protein DprA [Oscillospiraceae bacterium]|nr:DNA-protecting protein DprA [Oscillospiraceae bacterium]